MSLPQPPKIVWPLSAEKVASQRAQEGFHPFPAEVIEVRAAVEGMYYKANGSVEASDLAALAQACILSMFDVRDGHFPEFSVVQSGFLRELWLDVDTSTGEVSAKLWFSFTTPLCPSGESMLNACETLVAIGLTELGIPKVKVECRTGGTPWTADDAREETAKSFFKHALEENVQKAREAGVSGSSADLNSAALTMLAQQPLAKQ